MASPIDVNACYDAIYSAWGLVEAGLMGPEEFEEMRITMLSIARKYATVLMGAKLRTDDVS